jgi:DNA modification methylase
MTEDIFIGDVLKMIGSVRDESVDCCVTSPPYYGLRDYGMDGQLGLEQSPSEYIENLVEVFRCVRRAIRNDGTLWVNIGDSYAGSGKGPAGNLGKSHNERDMSYTHLSGKVPDGCKPKDLIGIPWMLAFALRADGWYLRQDIIWHKPNPMPESVKDRCTKSHEYIFMLSKSPKYYYDADAIKEPCVNGDSASPRESKGAKTKNSGRRDKQGELGKQTYTGFNERYFSKPALTHRNKRDVWTVTTKPYKGSHFATFPPDLIEPCILAGSRVGGVVLDPFMGSGTTCMVAKQNGRGYIGIELNPEYVELAKKRIYEGAKDGVQVHLAI